MSLDNIQLPAFLIQELYKNSLVKFESPGPVQKIEVKSSINILGNNRSKVIIVVENNEAAFLPDNQLNFLLGILSACKLTMEDVAIINIYINKAITYKAILLELKAEKIILFGVKPAQLNLPVEFPSYQIQQYNNQTYVTAAMLADIESDKTEKTKLWNCLKQIFAI